MGEFFLKFFLQIYFDRQLITKVRCFTTAWKNTFLIYVIKTCYLNRSSAQMYFAAKTTAEKAAWKYAKENGIDMVTVHPSLVFGPFITPYTSFSIDAAISFYTSKLN